MALTAQRQQEGASWSEILPILTNPVDSLEESFLEAVTAIASSRSKGYLTDEQADILMREAVAVMVEVELNKVIFRPTSDTMEWPLVESGRPPGRDLLSSLLSL